jgi:oxygen-independent coproporphyrinogen-3 oxidase
MNGSAHNIEHLYIHVPFCAAKCGYCAFYSRPGNFEQMRGFVEAVLSELNQYALQLVPATIYIGGGTPSFLPLELWKRLLTGLRGCLPREGIKEWTLECNPATVDAEKASLWREAGLNRISLGVQSFDDRLLKMLGRIHTAAEALDTYRLLHTAGFSNINLDLMFALPGQTMAQWRDTLHNAVALDPEHISAYCLTPEENTAFAGFVPDEEQFRAMYEMTIETLAAANYRHYEISNFAKPGYECSHNIAYWEGKDYLGLGPSSCSTIGNRRWQNIPDADRYIAGIINHQPSTISEELLTPELRQAERVAFGLRMIEGVPAELVRGRWSDVIAGLLRDRLVCWNDGHLQLTRHGLFFADRVAAEFV